jgi:hypothetical protein
MVLEFFTKLSRCCPVGKQNIGLWSTGQHLFGHHLLGLVKDSRATDLRLRLLDFDQCDILKTTMNISMIMIVLARKFALSLEGVKSLEFS